MTRAALGRVSAANQEALRLLKENPPTTLRRPAYEICAPKAKQESVRVLSISLIPSKIKGIPTAVFRRADGREFYLHSRQDPLEEARFLVQDVPRLERTMYVVLGFGLGYHVKALLARIPRSSHILVMEPDSARLSTVVWENSGDHARAWMHNGRLHFIAHHSPEAAPLSLADHLARQRLTSLHMMTHIPSTLTAESFYRVLLAEIPQKFPASFQTHLNSLDKMLENSLRNYWANLPHSWDAAPVDCLLGKWSGRPLIIVSAGPSLTEALPTLRRAKGTALLLATGTAARILSAHQIRPDLVISLDPYEPNLEHFKGWDASDVPLIYDHRICRGILAMHSGPKFFFVMKDDSPIPMVRSREKTGFRSGGSVAFSALQLAHYLDANPIIFVGQDFAFAGGHTHADGCIVDQTFDANALPENYYLVPGVGGTPVITSRIYHSYLLCMQDYLLDFARLKPRVRHINTSRFGARIQGMEYVAAENVLAALAALTPPSPRDLIASALESKQRIPQDARKMALSQWTADLDHLLAHADQLADFDRLFARFRGTSVYAQSARSYDDIYYLYETRYRGKKERAFLNRFVEHLQSVMEELRRISAAA